MNSNKLISLISILVFSSSFFAQPFNIGHTTITFNDSNRNRTIETEIYYPSATTGEDVNSATGNFSVIVFGHGFVMGWDSYQNFWEELVPNGYVLCFPTTEGGTSPNHEEFGKDLKFIANEIQNENSDNNSVLFNAISTKTAIMGHSMGGGASFLAAENNSNIHTIINFAAAETTPSAISAASNVNVPTLLFSGVDDCVTPPNEHQDIMYDSLTSNCKTQINIIDGSHCYFPNYNFNCTFGESFCNSTPELPREEQHQVTFDFLNLWLDYTLNNNITSFNTFNDSLQESTKVTSRQSCNSINSNIITQTELEVSLYPNPALDELNITLKNTELKGEIIIYNSLGKTVYKTKTKSNNLLIDISNLDSGFYKISYINNADRVSKSFIKNKP